MSKESTLAQACPGCNMLIAFPDYHLRHCKSPIVNEVDFSKKRKRKRKR